MQISCPVNDNKQYAILVGSSTRTITAFGQLLKVPNPGPQNWVRVVIFAGILTDPPPGSVDPTNMNHPAFTCGDLDGQQWCAVNIPIPIPGGSGSSGGAPPYTIFAYHYDITGLVARDSTPFQGQDNTGAVCSCGSGSSSMILPPSPLVGAILAAARLQISVPDGPLKGHHIASSVGLLRWSVTLNGQMYQLTVCPRRGLVLGLGTREAAGKVEFAPFSATFDGGLFQAGGTVVVTIP